MALYSRALAKIVHDQATTSMVARGRVSSGTTTNAGRGITGTLRAARSLIRSRMWKRSCAISSRMSSDGGPHEKGDNSDSQEHGCCATGAQARGASVLRASQHNVIGGGLCRAGGAVPGGGGPSHTRNRTSQTILSRQDEGSNRLCHTVAASSAVFTPIFIAELQTHVVGSLSIHECVP